MGIVDSYSNIEVISDLQQKEKQRRKNRVNWLFKGNDTKEFYYRLIPKDPINNLKFRNSVIKRITTNHKFANDIWNMCSRDILFTVNLFCWTFDPRKKQDKVLPFITYDYQDKALLQIIKCVEEGEDLVIEKTRDMGASWLCIVAFWWLWLFKPMSSFGFVSKTEDLVDKTDSPDSLFWKFDFLNKGLPFVFQRNIDRYKLHIGNRNNGSTIDGFTTTTDSARGGRKTAMLIDEFAYIKEGYRILSGTADVTNCRIFNSTPNGVSNAFYDKVRSPYGKKIKMHWSLHPNKREGLYKSYDIGNNKMNLQILDRSFKFPKTFKFVLDGKLRSIWYDSQCLRRSSREISQELDINYEGSGSQYFTQEVINDIRDKFCCEPILRGHIHYDFYENVLSNIRFVEDKQAGRFALWQNLNLGGVIDPKEKYVVSCDTSAGTGASNSALSIGLVRTNEKIGEYVDPYIKPYEFARLAVSISKLFNNAYLIWETNGPGREFGDTVLEIGYKHIYYKMVNEGTSRRKASDIPGWFPTPLSKTVLLGSYRQGLSERTFIERSVMALNEASEYVYTVGGGIEHAKSINCIDPSGARANHGDRVISSALLLYGISIFKEFNMQDEKERTLNNPNTFGARQQEFLAKKKNSLFW